MAEILDARVKQKTGVSADFAGYQLLAGEIALVRTSASGPVWNFKVGPGNFDSLDWSLQNPGAAQKADTSTVFPVGVPGLYIPTESGTIGGVPVDLSAGYTQLIWDGANLVDVVFPIDLAGYATKSDFEAVEDVLAAKFGTEMIIRSLITRGAWELGSSSKNTSNNWISTAKIPVLPLTTYTLIGCGPGMGASNPGVILFGSGGSSTTRSIFGGYQEYLIFTTAADEYFVGVNIQAQTNVGVDPPASPYYHSVSLVEGEPVKFDIPGDKIVGNIATNQINSMESSIDDLMSFLTYAPKSATLTIGGITASGTSTNTANWRRTSVTNVSVMFQLLDESEKLAYSGEIVANSPDFVGVAYYNSGLSFLGYECIDVGVYDRYKLTPPPGTRYIGSCSYNSDPVIETIGAPSGFGVFHVSATASPGGDGTEASPFNTISAAISAAVQTVNATIVVWEGDYRESLGIHNLPSGSFRVINREGHRVRILGSEQLTGWTKTSGRTNVYDIAFSGTIPNWSRYDNPIFEDGRPSKPIDPNEYHPLQKNLQYRLPFTPIVSAASIDDVDSTPGSYYVTGGRMYLHTSDSDNPATNGFSYENAVRTTSGSINAVNTTKKIDITFRGLQFLYNTSGIRMIGFNSFTCEFVTCLGTPSEGAFRTDTGKNEMYYCEAGFCNGDGFNGHFSSYGGYENLSDNRSNYPTTRYVACWSHDNFDDGESSHEQHNVFMDSCLLEYNGDSGCRPSNDSTYYVKDSVFRNNGWEVGHGGSAGKGEGFAVVNPAINPERLGVRAILFNCQSIGNNTGYGTISNSNNRIELVNCTARDNETAEYYAGQGTMVLRNCKATNADPAKIKVVGSGAIAVENDANVV